MGGLGYHEIWELDRAGLVQVEEKRVSLDLGFDGGIQLFPVREEFVEGSGF